MKVLVLVLSSHLKPYDNLYRASRATWDSEKVEDVETLYYFSENSYFDGEHIILTGTKEGLFNMGFKTLEALRQSLSREWDFMARVNSSCYVNKKALYAYCQSQPTSDLFAGSEVVDTPRWMWGGGQYLMSRDVVQKIVDNADKWNQKEVEDVAMSRLVDKLGIPYSKGKSCSINLKPDGTYLFLTYPDGSGSKDINQLNELAGCDHHFYRVKVDGNRAKDVDIMTKLWSIL